MFRVAKSQLYTSRAVIEAEQRILAVAGDTGAHRVTEGDVQIAMLEWSANTGGTLNTAQQAMIREVATGGRRVHLVLAPAGTGKTTMMGVLARA